MTWLKKPATIAGLLILAAVAGALYVYVAPADGTVGMGGDDATIKWLSLATSVVSLVTAIVGLLTAVSGRKK